MKGVEQRPLKVNAAGQVHKQTDTFVYLGGTIRQDVSVGVEIAGRGVPGTELPPAKQPINRSTTAGESIFVRLKVRVLIMAEKSLRLYFASV